MPKKYLDFIESAPHIHAAKKSVRDATDARSYITITCPHCKVDFVEITQECLSTNKASACKKHLLTCEAAAAAGVRIEPVKRKQTSAVGVVSAAAPIATGTVTDARNDESRHALEGRLDDMRESQQREREESERRHQEAERRHQEAERRHQEAERRHQEVLAELRATRGTLDGFVSIVSRELSINPPDVATVSVNLPRKLEFHNKRMNDLQSYNQLSNDKLKEAERKIERLERENAKLKRRRPGVRVEVKDSVVHTGITILCESETGRKLMRTALHPDKYEHLPSADANKLKAGAKMARDGLGL